MRLLACLGFGRQDPVLLQKRSIGCGQMNRVHFAVNARPFDLQLSFKLTTAGQIDVCLIPGVESAVL